MNPIAPVWPLPQPKSRTGIPKSKTKRRRKQSTTVGYEEESQRENRENRSTTTARGRKDTSASLQSIVGRMKSVRVYSDPNIMTTGKETSRSKRQQGIVKPVNEEVEGSNSHIDTPQLSDLDLEEIVMSAKRDRASQSSARKSSHPASDSKRPSIAKTSAGVKRSSTTQDLSEGTSPKKRKTAPKQYVKVVAPTEPNGDWLQTTEDDESQATRETGAVDESITDEVTESEAQEEEDLPMSTGNRILQQTGIRNVLKKWIKNEGDTQEDLGEDSLAEEYTAFEDESASHFPSEEETAESNPG